jgi:hypothetical protein
MHFALGFDHQVYVYHQDFTTNMQTNATFYELPTGVQLSDPYADWSFQSQLNYQFN